VFRHDAIVAWLGKIIHEKATVMVFSCGFSEVLADSPERGIGFG
jgi:hypothetical protein